MVLKKLEKPHNSQKDKILFIQNYSTSEVSNFRGFFLFGNFYYKYPQTHQCCRGDFNRPYISNSHIKITINGKDIDEFFGLETLKVIVRQPLTVTNTTDKYDVICSVQGGGFTGQAGAIRHGIARALNAANIEYRPALKSNGFLTRDPRMKERKKYGLKKARKAPQFSKR